MRPRTYRVVYERETGNGKKRGAPDDHVFVILESLGYLISVLARLLDRSLNARLQQHGSSFGQWPVLLALWAEDGLLQIDLARRAAIEPATLVLTLDRMERDGFVRRQRLSHDRRLSGIYLTAKGRQLRDELIQCGVENIEWPPPHCQTKKNSK